MNNQATIHKILDVFQLFRMPPTPIDKYEEVGKNVLAEKLSSFVDSEKPLEFVMLGFPHKSTNIRDKVIGKIPDMAELATLQNIERYSRDVSKVYEPGIIWHMVSDGFIFNDLLEVPDAIVEAYKEIAMDMHKSAPIKWYDIRDFYGNKLSINSSREKIMEQFGITAEKLENDILFNPDVNFLYRGMSIFMFEELAMKSYPSRNQHQKAAKALARRMMFNNEAYSNLVRHEFSDKIRLSMHPSVNDGAKYSFQLINSPNAHHSAWHAALCVNEDGTISTMHRKDAEEQGFDLVYKDNKPFYYTKAH